MSIPFANVIIIVDATNQKGEIEKVMRQFTLTTVVHRAARKKRVVSVAAAAWNERSQLH